jgi:hypothetical protein
MRRQPAPEHDDQQAQERDSLFHKQIQKKDTIETKGIKTSL